MAKQNIQNFIQRFRQADTQFINGMVAVAALMNEFKAMGAAGAFPDEEFAADPNAPQPSSSSASGAPVLPPPIPSPFGLGGVTDLTRTEFLTMVNTFNEILTYIEDDPAGPYRLPSIYRGRQG